MFSETRLKNYAIPPTVTNVLFCSKNAMPDSKRTRACSAPTGSLLIGDKKSGTTQFATLNKKCPALKNWLCGRAKNMFLACCFKLVVVANVFLLWRSHSCVFILSTLLNIAVPWLPPS